MTVSFQGKTLYLLCGCVGSNVENLTILVHLVQSCYLICINTINYIMYEKKPCIKACLLCSVVLEAEKEFIEAAKRNDVETMTDIGKGLNANVKNVVRLKR